MRDCWGERPDRLMGTPLISWTWPDGRGLAVLWTEVTTGSADGKFQKD